MNAECAGKNVTYDVNTTIGGIQVDSIGQHHAGKDWEWDGVMTELIWEGKEEQQNIDSWEIVSTKSISLNQSRQ